MKITLITVGKIKEKYLKDAIAEYSKRLSKYCKLEIVEVADEKTPDQASENVERQIRQKEGERILRYVKDDAYVFTLEIGGTMLDWTNMKFLFCRFIFCWEIQSVKMASILHRMRFITGQKSIK